MLAIARALMGRPKLLLLDEPSLGLAPLIVKQIFEVIKELNSNHGLPVFIVEQNAYHSLKLAHRGYVMVNGRITLSGSGSELLNSEEVQTAYLDGGRRKEPRRSLPLSYLSDDGPWVFLVLTCILGGGAAFLAGPRTRAKLEAVLADFLLHGAARRARCASSTTPCSTAR